MSAISNNSINNKTFIYHLANTFRGSEFLCKIILFLFVHNIHKAVAVIGDTTLNPTVRKYYADRLLKRELVGVVGLYRYDGYVAGDGKVEFPKDLVKNLQRIATLITSSGNTLIKDWLTQDYELYLDKSSYRMWRNNSNQNYPKYTTNLLLKNVLKDTEFLKTLEKDPSLDTNIRDAFPKS